MDPAAYGDNVPVLVFYVSVTSAEVNNIKWGSLHLELAVYEAVFSSYIFSISSKCETQSELLYAHHVHIKIAKRSDSLNVICSCSLQLGWLNPAFYFFNCKFDVRRTCYLKIHCGS